MTKVTHEFNLYGKNYKIETGELAKQATGSVLVGQGDTLVLITAVVGKQKKDIDFFPLTVDVAEKMYAVGRIPGGYVKRETRPSDKGTLMARTIDRPVRTGFPDGFRNEVQIVATILSADQQNYPDMISVNGASAALLVGGVPYAGPAAAVTIGRNSETGEYIVNPTYDEQKISDLELTIAGTPDYITMIEASAHEVSEDEMLAAMDFGTQAVAAFCAEQAKFLGKCEIEPKEFEANEISAEITARVQPFAAQITEALKDSDKLNRVAKVAEVKELIKASFSEEEQAEFGSDISAAAKNLEKHAMRDMVLQTGERVDGRSTTEIRPISSVAGYLPHAHGSGLFTRGQTQALSVLTLGMMNEWQRLDTIDPSPGKRYMHQYNFPPYSTGECGRMGAPKRRELGHGDLAERALLPVLPDETEFPYSIRVVSEVLESNGSSSMASACGSTIALMDAGVPIKRPVAGIAMGLIKEGDDIAILSDIQGLEDFLGDMDFKVCGSAKGITALQMDNKAKGLSLDILAKALAQAKEGREHILGKIDEAINTPRATVKDFAPHIITIQIPVDKIREVIGSGGKVIRAIQEETGADIEINEDGTVYISSKDAGGDAALERVTNIVRDPEVGEEYDGKVVSITTFGAFIEILPGKDGLLHISKVANGRVDKVEDMLAIDDIVRVIVQEIDGAGKVSLDRLDKPDAPAGAGNSVGGNRSNGNNNSGNSRSSRNSEPRRRH